ncbi:hypothetical protein A2230_01375 [candidate division WOR-1 bacterium RIFOXYA2_FULL_36_21]|uniref:D-lactate dehydrogenase (cytochrome) n=1 Tax=candidate division WOR-1 bacterium RIFOXYB2_FULL_36_35 TaxID=1802578 RepID=A0A1F4S6B2_UNCSA|nr:MAG: hypothetical protein A2230_01375 [candidate division WOR-1 bacterium RIFOXYA2_FULL_36_21]OGC14374.1 MAG: hypothetical protein A2282_07980 [candidate division WOR-1 bacterium RIFOXYA12_FULL_36_13]OGC15950.1 MAG: hypothetical protein A2290_06845 [candidate division WOR-1 bacterium RIFOXYB2_FULL_36_35]
MIKKTDQAEIQSYLEDSSNLQGGYAEGLFLPENEKEIASLLQEANSKKMPLTVSAGTTGTTGGCIPFGGWILGTEKLDKIINIDPTKKTALLQPAVTLEKLESETKKLGLLYPPDPTEQTAFIGGTLATNASGARSFRFGATRNWIKRIKVTLTSGKTLDIKRGYKIQEYGIKTPNYKMPNTKTSAGYFSTPEMEMIDLFIGSEGTLGVITEIEIKLIPNFHDTFDIIVFFLNEETAITFVEKARIETDVLKLEYFDNKALNLLRPSYPKLPSHAATAVYMETEITESIQNTYLDKWARLLENLGADMEKSWLGVTNKQKEELKEFRHSMAEHINEKFKKHHSIKFASDIAVPDGKLMEMINFYNDKLSAISHKLFHVKFGHIGQNHLHVNLVPNTPNDIPLAKEIIADFVRKGVSLGGTCSAEHGIGKIKHDYLKMMYGDKGIEEMIKIKKTFDPQDILNRGNIFPANP